MRDKYVIKNCPCFDKHNTQCLDTPTLPITEITLCQDCTACLLKQIVELCRGNKEYTLEYLGHRDMLAEEILQLLDIQEVE